MSGTHEKIIHPRYVGLAQLCGFLWDIKHGVLSEINLGKFRELLELLYEVDRMEGYLVGLRQCERNLGLDLYYYSITTSELERLVQVSEHLKQLCQIHRELCGFLARLKELEKKQKPGFGQEIQERLAAIPAQLAEHLAKAGVPATDVFPDDEEEDPFVMIRRICAETKLDPEQIF